MRVFTMLLIIRLKTAPTLKVCRGKECVHQGHTVGRSAVLRLSISRRCHSGFFHGSRRVDAPGASASAGGAGLNARRRELGRSGFGGESVHHGKRFSQKLIDEAHPVRASPGNKVVNCDFVKKKGFHKCDLPTASGVVTILKQRYFCNVHRKTVTCHDKIFGQLRAPSRTT